MIPLADCRERRFRAPRQLREFLSSRDRQDFDVRGRDVELTKEGILRSPDFEGPLSGTAWQGLLEVLSVPQDFASQVCPPDLAVEVVNRLLSRSSTELRLRTVHDTARGVMPRDRLPIEHKLLAEWFPEGASRFQATLGSDALRITFTREDVEVLPGDVYGRGWELISDENGLHGTEVHRYVRRLVCANGLVGFRRTATFRRRTGSDTPVLQELAELRKVLAEDTNWALREAARWASDHQIQGQCDEAVGYLSRQLEGNTTRMLLGDINPDSTWYDLLNTVTEHARTRPLSTRRRYEWAGGQLLRWFQTQGRAPGPWEDARCAGCQYFQEADAVAAAEASN